LCLRLTTGIEHFIAFLLVFALLHAGFITQSAFWPSVAVIYDGIESNFGVGKGAAEKGKTASHHRKHCS
jgi:hypothetical protein